MTRLRLEVERPRAQSTRNRAATTLVGLGTQGLLRAVTNVLIGRLAGAATLGLVSSMTAMAQFLFTLWPATGGTGASKYMARARGSGDLDQAALVARHVLGRVLIVSSVLAGIVAVGWHYVGDETSWVGAVPVGLLVLGLSAQATARGLHYGASLVLRGTGLDLVTTAAGLILLVILLMLGVRGSVLVLPLAAGGLVFGLLSLPRRPKGQLDRADRREIDVFITLAASGSIFSAGLVQLALIAARVTGGNSGAGHFSAALTLATPVLLASSALSTALLPSMSEAVGRGNLEAVRAQTDRATRVLALLLVPVCGALAVSSPIIVPIIFGSGFEEAARILPWLSLAMMSSALAVPSVNSLTTQSQRGTAIAAAVPALTAAAGVASWMMMKGSWGTESVAIGYFTAAVLTAASLFSVAWVRDHQRWRPLAIRLFVGYLSVFIAVAFDRAHSGTVPVLISTIGVIGLSLLLSTSDKEAWATLTRLARRSSRPQQSDQVCSEGAPPRAE